MLMPVVETATKDLRAKAMSTILLGFAADPVARFFFPDPAQYLDQGLRFLEAFGGRAFDHGTAYVADGVKAVALWLPPGVSPDEETMGAIAEEAIGLRPEIAAAAAGVFQGMAKFHPHEPHWYLPLIAADPSWIGLGLGAALMKHAPSNATRRASSPIWKARTRATSPSTNATASAPSAKSKAMTRQ